MHVSEAGCAEPCGVYLVFCLHRRLKYALLHRSVCECVSDSAVRDVSRVTEPLLFVTATRSNNPAVDNFRRAGMDRSRNRGSISGSKGKAIPLQTWRGPKVSTKLRLPDFKTIGT